MIIKKKTTRIIEVLEELSNGQIVSIEMFSDGSGNVKTPVNEEILISFENEGDFHSKALIFTVKKLTSSGPGSSS